MIEAEVKSEVEKLIEVNGLAAKITKLESEYDNYYDEYWRVHVEVERQDYKRACSFYGDSDHHSINWRQKTPELIGAEVGNLVLIYSHRMVGSEDVGLVSSKFTEDGNVYYGCRYLLLGLGNQFVSNLHDFELTGEIHGGFHLGFLKVLTPEQALELLQVKLGVAFEKEKESVQTRYERANKNLKSLVDYLGTTKKIKCETTRLDDNFGLSLSIKGK